MRVVNTKKSAAHTADFYEFEDISLGAGGDLNVTPHPPPTRTPKALKFALGNPGGGPPCLAAARSRFGSYIINVIHYQNAVSLPAGEGFYEGSAVVDYYCKNV